MALSGKINGEVLHGKAEIPGLVPGPSAYEVAVKNGFKGTEAEWLASLKGADGADGEKGEKGDGIPPIHAEDADKVLTANADGTAEWKRHGALYDGTVTATDTGNGNVLGNLGAIIPLTQGAAYKVTFNGIDYKCVGSKEDIYPYLGNAHFLIDSAEDTGEPFCLMFATHTTYLRTNESGSYTLAIYEATGGGLSVTEVSSPEEITADSPDGFYVVPGGESGESGGSGGSGGLPVVEIVSVLSKEPTSENSLFGELSEGETNALTAAAQANSPIIVKFPFTLDGESVIGSTLVFGRYGMGDTYMYQAELVLLADEFKKILVLIHYEDGAWIYAGFIL